VTKASEVLLSQLSTDIASTPYDIVYEEDRVKLKHYRLEGEAKLKTPLLVVYALINRETMLDLQPDRSVVKNFLRDGIDLYMVDWGYPPGRTGLSPSMITSMAISIMRWILSGRSTTCPRST